MESDDAVNELTIDSSNIASGESSEKTESAKATTTETNVVTPERMEEAANDPFVDIESHDLEDADNFKQQALIATQKLVQLHQKLIKDNPDHCKSDLASALTDLSKLFLDLERREAALAAQERAVSVYTELASTDPGRFKVHLAKSLHGLSTQLFDLGRLQRALSTLEEAVRLRQELALEADLAFSYTHLALIHVSFQQVDEAIAVLKRAIKLYRGLESDGELPINTADYWSTQYLLALVLSRAGQREESTAAHKEADQLMQGEVMSNTITIKRYASLLSAEIAPHQQPSDPESFDPSIQPSLPITPRSSDEARAAFLYDQTMQHFKHNLHDEALVSMTETLSLQRKLAEEFPTSYKAVLADSLLQLGLQLFGIGRRDEGLASIMESVQVWRYLSTHSPSSRSTYGLAVALNSLSLKFSIVGRQGEALEAATEAVKRCRECTGDNFVMRKCLAIYLHTLSQELFKANRRGEALLAAKESVQTLRELGECGEELHKFVPTLCDQLKQDGQHQETIEAFTFLIEVRRALATSSPDRFKLPLALALHDLGRYLFDLGLQAEGLVAVKEAVELGNELLEFSHDDSVAWDLRKFLCDLHGQLTTLGLLEEAVATWMELVHLDRRLAAGESEERVAALATSLQQLSVQLIELGRSREAWQAGEEALALMEELTLVKSRKIPGKDLEATKKSVAELRKTLGIAPPPRDAPRKSSTAIGRFVKKWQKKLGT